MTTAQRSALVVEDDPDIRELITHSLSMQGFAVHATASGRAALDLVARQSPDLVTLDLGLPDLDGVEVCRRIRQQSDAYVVMISARVEEVDRLIGLEIGADDYLTKPFSPRELHARVNAMFRRPRTAPAPATSASALAETQSAAPQPPSSGRVAAGRSGTSAGPRHSTDDSANAKADDQADDSVIVLGRICVDTDSRTVSLDGREVDLTRTEFDLLATMIAKPRRVWGRDVLLRLVWGEGWTDDEHLVEVHVGNLRRKLNRAASPAPALPFIRTVRGVGYRMEAPEQLSRLTA